MDPDRGVDRGLIAELCELATWAPNHKRLEPWRFAVLSGDARAQLGVLTAEHQIAQGEIDPDRVAKSRSKYLRSPVVVVIGALANPSPVLHAENRDAVAAAVQTFLLGATARGLHTYWGTGATTHAPEVKRLVGLAPEDTIVAIVYLGWPLGPVEVPPRQPPTIIWLG